jgi:hypothetical protein
MLGGGKKKEGKGGGGVIITMGWVQNAKGRKEGK